MSGFSACGPGCLLSDFSLRALTLTWSLSTPNADFLFSYFCLALSRASAMVLSFKTMQGRAVPEEATVKRLRARRI